MKTISLNGSWAVCPRDFNCAGEAGLRAVLEEQNDWIPAQVPGEIHLDLMRAGQMPDPSVGANMPLCRDPETKSWWFRTNFKLSEDFISYEHQELVFDGLDLNAQVFINRVLAGESANAFVPISFNAGHLLKKGENELVVRLTAGSELALDATPPGQGQLERTTEDLLGGAVPNPMQEGALIEHRMWPGKKWLRKPQFSYGWDWVDALPNIGI